MVIISIFGGLGNQMFQYALGRHLSHKLNTDLKIDDSHNLSRTDFDPGDIPSIFDVFNIKKEKATTREIGKFKAQTGNFSFKNIYFQFKRKYPGFFSTKYRFIYEPYFNFNRDILSLSNHCYLSGYWQSEKYFIDDENLIREDFKILKPLAGKNLEIAQKIKQTESVSIHLRGRDYNTNEKTKKILFTCGRSYYERSISLIREKTKSPHFFVFSDDPEWAKTLLGVNRSLTFVEGNSWNKASFEDMRLMSLCKHNIIANSTFSWWSAWLNQNLSKIVIAPQRWFNDTSYDARDLIPGGWLRL